MSEDAEKARRLVRDVILVQTNVFIKELLFDNDIRGGATKADFEEQLLQAIDENKITYDALRAWVDKTEGWGDEHVYLYKLHDPVKDILHDEKRVADRVRRAGLSDLWKSDTSLAFPETLALTRVDLAGDELTCTWHQRANFLKRESKKDFDEPEEDGEHYFYKAYREVARRDVFRVVAKRTIMAVFLPGGQEPATHEDVRKRLGGDIAKLLSFANCEIYSMSEAIKLLDSAATKQRVRSNLRAHLTRFKATAGGYVEFASATDDSYADVESLRNVRSAVEPRKFRGAGAHFDFLPPARTSSPSTKAAQGGAAEKLVRVHLFGDYDRIRLTVRLSREDVWWILKKIPKRIKCLPTGKN